MKMFVFGNRRRNVARIDGIRVLAESPLAARKSFCQYSLVTPLCFWAVGWPDNGFDFKSKMDVLLCMLFAFIGLQINYNCSAGH